MRGVSKSYGTTRALDDVSFTLARGEFVGLLGPNGAGKSTLLGIIAGLVRVDRGTASVLGHDVVKAYRLARRALGFVPQELAFDPFLTVRESLELQAGYFGLGSSQRPWIDHLLATLGLADRERSEMRALSGGMKRRVLVAQALVHKPPVVILDEPTAGVDAAMRTSLWSLLGSLRAEGHSFVLTTHYVEEAERLCDRVVILHAGRVTAQRDRGDWLADSGLTTLRLTLREDLGDVPADLAPFVVSRTPHTLVLRLDTTVKDLADVIAALRARGAHITTMDTRGSTLEDLLAPPAAAVAAQAPR